MKPVRKDTQSPKQEQSVAPQTGPWSNKNFKKKKKKKKKKRITNYSIIELLEQCIEDSFNFK